MKELKRIDLCLENCEVIPVDRKYIGHFYLDDIKTSISRIALNSISSMKKCEEFAIQINRDLPKESVMKYTIGDIEQKRNPLKRLYDHSDLTSVRIVYEDDTVEDICVDWHKDDEYNNRYQKSWKNDFNDLYIVIASNKKLEDFYNLDEENDKDYVEFNWEMFEE